MNKEMFLKLPLDCKLIQRQMKIALIQHELNKKNYGRELLNGDQEKHVLQNLRHVEFLINIMDNFQLNNFQSH